MMFIIVVMLSNWSSWCIGLAGLAGSTSLPDDDSLLTVIDVLVKSAQHLSDSHPSCWSFLIKCDVRYHQYC